MNSLFSLGMWGVAFIGFGLVFLIFALVFAEDKAGAFTRIGLTLCGVFGLGCVLVGLVFMGHAPAVSPSWIGFEALVAYVFSFVVGLALAAFALAIFAGARHHHKPIWNAGKF